MLCWGVVHHVRAHLSRPDFGGETHGVSTWACLHASMPYASMGFVPGHAACCVLHGIGVWACCMHTTPVPQTATYALHQHVHEGKCVQCRGSTDSSLRGFAPTCKQTSLLISLYHVYQRPHACMCMPPCAIVPAYHSRLPATPTYACCCPLHSTT